MEDKTDIDWNRFNLKTLTAKKIKAIAKQLRLSGCLKVKRIQHLINGIAKRVNELKQLIGLLKLKESESALKQFATKYTIEGRPGYDAETFMQCAKHSITDLLKRRRQTKVKMVLCCKMKKTDIKTGKTIERDAYFHSDQEVNLESTDVDGLYDKMVDTMMERKANFQRHGSNWRFVSVLELEVHMVEYIPLKGSSWIELPEALKGKRAIINMKNEDDQECFKWAVTRALNPVDKNPQRITKELKEQAKQLEWGEIKFPVSINDGTIDKFEKLNPSISINVYGYEEYKKRVYPLKISESYELSNKDKKHINLLLISDETKQHYCWIKDMSRLCAAQVGSKNKIHLCLRCLNNLPSVDSLEKHDVCCRSYKAVRIDLPKEGTTLTFKYFNRSMRVPFVVYADFESFITPLATCHPNPKNSYTNKYQKHTPSGFCYYIKCFDEKVYSKRPVIYSKQNETDDVAQIFVDMLEQDIKDIYRRHIRPIKPMKLSKAEEDDFRDAITCHICDKEFDPEDEMLKKVRDHCHISGKFRGAAHNKCNLDYKVPRFFPVLFHNLSGYDSHLFIKKLASRNGENITCIPNNEEKYISFSRDVIVDKFVDNNDKQKLVQVKRELRFIDSFRFMPSSLEKLVQNLDKDQCVNLKKYFEGERLNLLRRKGVYPYDYMDAIEKLDETKLPPKEAFYSRLNNEDISDEDYAHAQKVWDTFGCETIRCYHELYNKSDVLQLADVFENFRDVCLNNYKLDPAWYYTSPGLAWDACLKITDVKLELLSDIDMLLMFEKGIRGGICMASHRYAKANNKYMGNQFDPDKLSKYIAYLDANNLYGWAMSKPLPTHGFKWMTEEELENWKDYPCILEVDLEYPSHLHDPHNNYPLAPEPITINKVEKLTPNLRDKVKYVVHYENLKLYERLGLITTKIYRGIKFEESQWLKKYINKNTELRTRAKNDFEKDFFKLMNNSVFGKTMENIRNRVDVRLVTSREMASKLSVKPNFQHCTIFDENLVAIHMRKTALKFNKPVYLGMCILDLSKTLMYDFHHNYIRPKYVQKANLLYTDTDSLIYEIETEDFFKDISSDVEQKFDTSDYPKDHPSGIPTGVNKKVLGTFKDEAFGEIIQEFVGLRVKLYSSECSNKMNTKHAKVLRKTL